MNKYEQRVRETLEKFLQENCRRFSECTLFSERDDVDDNMWESNEYYDVMKGGKEWLYEFTSMYQPRVGKILLEGSYLYYLYNINSIPVQALNGGIDTFVSIKRNVKGNNFSDTNNYWLEHQKERGGTIREYSLPKSIFKAYYYRFSGLGLTILSKGEDFGGFGGNILPLHSGSYWYSISNYLESLDLGEKHLIFIDSHFPDKLSRHSNMLEKDDPYVGLMCFLDTRVDRSKKEGDVFFVKTEVQDKIIYHIKDGDVENMRILSGYQEAIDRYCEHVLLGKEGRFDFLPYTIDFISPVEMYDESLYAITEEEINWWKSRDETGENDARKWDVAIPKVYESLDDFEELKEKYL